MNFLLHHDFAMTELEVELELRPIGAVGAMLPDLWRMADRKVRPRDLGKSEDARPSYAPALRALLGGIDHHLQIDRWFHGSRVFTEGERTLRQRLLETKSPKLLLFAHPAWEMCLDGALLRESGVTKTASLLRDALDRAEALLERAADLHHFDRRERSLADRFRFGARMARIVSAGRDGSLFEDYLSADGISRRLAGMRMAFGFEKPHAEELDRWARALAEAVDMADSALKELRQERADSPSSDASRAPPGSAH